MSVKVTGWLNPPYVACTVKVLGGRTGHQQRAGACALGIGLSSALFPHRRSQRSRRLRETRKPTFCLSTWLPLGVDSR